MIAVRSEKRTKHFNVLRQTLDFFKLNLMV
jgi:hypothetical protein